jgi:hypothetical protein
MKYSSDFESDTIARAALAFLGHLKMLFFTQNFHLSVANSENYILFRSVASATLRSGGRFRRFLMEDLEMRCLQLTKEYQLGTLF